MTKALADRRPIIRLALSRSEVALAIGVSVGSVDEMVKEGALPPPRKWHSRKLWLVSEIEAHLNDWPVDGAAPVDPHDRLPAFSTSAYEAAKGPGGYPIPASPDDPIQQWYDKLGFDPRTMDASDMTRLQAAADARWRATIPGTPLSKREKTALLQFDGCKVDALMSWREIRKCGHDTAERLEARGFIEIRMLQPDRIEGYVLTAAGEEAVRGLVETGPTKG